MSTLAELRAQLRVVLNDGAAGGYLWSDGQLNRLLNDAVKALSAELPREMSVDVVSVVGQAEYSLPAGVIRVVRVYDRTAERELVAGGDSWGYGYRVFGGNLELLPTPGEAGRSYQVDYLGYHMALLLDGDVSSVPAGEEELLLVRAAAMAVLGLGTDEAKRRRFEEQAGQAAGDAAAGYLGAYTAGVKGRTRAVRSGSLVHRSGGGERREWES